MAHWLLKEEPTHYSFSDLVRDGRTEWNGVHNALALRHLRSMVVGDEAVYYHSGDVRAAVGIVRITRGPRADRTDPRPSVTVEVAAVRPLRRAVSLTELREDPALAGFDLLRIGRLSVVPVSDAHWDRLLAHEDAAETAGYGSPSSPRSARRSSAGTIDGSA